MNKFLDQFALTPMQRVDMEAFIFTQADKMVEGYSGGMWESQTLGKAVILVIPGSEPTVTLNNYAFGGEMTTDRQTASAAFSALVANWYANLRYEQGRASDAMLEAASNFAYALNDAAGELPNASDFYRFID